MIAERVLVDTNVLVYAYDKTSQRHLQAKAVLEEVFRERTGVLSAQNLAEFCRVMTQKIPRPLSHEQTHNNALELTAVFKVVSYDERIVLEALRLSEIHHIHYFDALLAATMAAHQLHVIVTENEKDFRKIPWLEVHNPFSV